MTSVKRKVDGTIEVIEDERIAVGPGESVYGPSVEAAAATVVPAWEPDITVTAGQVFADDGKLYVVRQSHTTQSAWRPTAQGVLALWARAFDANRTEWLAAEELTYTPPPQGIDAADPTATWEGAIYREYEGALYRLRQNPGVNIAPPPSAPAIWLLIPPPAEDSGEVAEWVSGEAGIQPGDQRRYEGVVYEAIQSPGVNIWPPPTVPNLWQVVA